MLGKTNNVKNAKKQMTLDNVSECRYFNSFKYQLFWTLEIEHVSQDQAGVYIF